MFCFELSELRLCLSFRDEDVDCSMFFILFKEILLLTKVSDTVIICNCFTVIV